MGNNPYEALERIAGYEFTGAGGDDDKSSTAGYEFAGGYEFTGASPLLRMPPKPTAKPSTRPTTARPILFNNAALTRLAPTLAATPTRAPAPAPMPKSVGTPLPPMAPIVNLAQLSAASRNAITSAPLPMVAPPAVLDAFKNGPAAQNIKDVLSTPAPAPAPAAAPTTANGAPMMALPPAAIGLPAPSASDLTPPNKPLPGGDSSALVSAARHGSKAGRAYQPQPINRGNSQMSNQPQLRETQPSRYREYPLGFATPVATPVAAGGTQSVPSQPQVVFRGVRLVVQSTIAPFFLINDIKVGKNSQLVSSNPLPADVFISTSVGVSLQMDTAQPGMTIAIEVFNSDAATHPFNAALIGSVME